MDLPWLMPMFDDRSRLFGIAQGDWVMLGILVVIGGGLGFWWWVRRLTTPEPPAHSFRATGDHRGSRLPLVVLVLVLGSLAFTLVVATRL